MKKILIILLSLCLLGCQKELKIITDDKTEYYIIEYKEDSVIVYPGFYERELHEEQSKDFIEMKVSKDCKFYSKMITKIVSEDNEDVTEEFEEVSEKEIREAVEYDSAFVILEYCEDKTITKMTLYGELIIWE